MHHRKVSHLLAHSRLQPASPHTPTSHCACICNTFLLLSLRPRSWKEKVITKGIAPALLSNIMPDKLEVTKVIQGNMFIPNSTWNDWHPDPNPQT